MIRSSLLMILFSASALWCSSTTGKTLQFSRVELHDLFQNSHVKYDKIRVKFNRNSSEELLQRHGRTRSLGSISPEFEKILTTYDIEAISPTIKIDRSNARATSVMRDQHQAMELDQWFDIETDSSTISDLMFELQFLSNVLIVEPIYEKVNYARSTSVNDEYYKKQWHYLNTGQSIGKAGADINVVPAWNIETGARDVVVAVVDGGVDYTHPDLAANIWKGIGYNFVEDTENITFDAHGTHVAGIVGASTNNSVGICGIAGGSGVHDGIRLMSCQIFNDTAYGGTAQALIWAADNGAVIAQNSWGYKDSLVYNQIDLDAIDYFKKHGGGSILNEGLLFFAAGNFGVEGTYYPGCYENVVAVASSNDEDEKASYSNYGTWVDITAPGGGRTFKGVYSTLPYGKYGFKDGTSMATPHVSGVAALLVSAALRYNISISSDQILDIIYSTADGVFSEEFAEKLGSGRLNAGQAMEKFSSTYLNEVVKAPRIVKAQSINSSSVTLEWKGEESVHNVLITASHSSTIESPIEGAEYIVGDSIGDAKVVYMGADTNFVDSGYSANDTVYYNIFSVDSNKTYYGYRSAIVTTGSFPQKGSKDDPIIIETIDDLKLISEDSRYWDRHIALANSLNLSETQSWNNGRGWIPIGDESVPFTGTFRGGGNRLDSIYISRNQNYVGLFGFVKNSEIDSLGITAFTIKAGSMSGGLAGKIVNTKVSEVFTSGELTGGSFLGGFVGVVNSSVVNNSYSVVDILLASENVGGFAGSCFYSDIQNCYSIGTLASRYSEINFGGFIGAGKADVSCFWDSTVSNMKISAGGTPKATDDFRSQESFQGWNFENTWVMNDDSGRPVLSWFDTSDVTSLLKDNKFSASKYSLEITSPVHLERDILRIVLNYPSCLSARFTIYDVLGNVVHKSSTLFTCENTTEYKWNLVKENGHKIAIGAYKVVVTFETAEGTFEASKLCGVKK